MVADIDSPREQYLGIHDTDVGFLGERALSPSITMLTIRNFLAVNTPQRFFSPIEIFGQKFRPN